MNKNYLHIHSTYSVGDSAQSPEDIVLQVKKTWRGKCYINRPSHAAWYRCIYGCWAKTWYKYDSGGGK